MHSLCGIVGKRFRIAAALFVLFIASTANAQTYQYVGSYKVNDGPYYGDNPPVYSAQEAAALLFGGPTSQYAISINSSTSDPSTITHTGHYSTWGGPCSIFAESYKYDAAPAGYDDPQGTEGTATSAYVQDWCYNGETNYVWRLVAAPVPALSGSSLVLLAGLLATGGLLVLRGRSS